MSDAENRLTDVEIKLAYVEKLYADLNEVVIAQARLLDDLSKRLGQVDDVLEGFAPGREFPHEKPPHY